MILLLQSVSEGAGSKQYRSDALMSKLMPSNQRKELIAQWEYKARQVTRATQTRVDMVAIAKNQFFIISSNRSTQRSTHTLIMSTLHSKRLYAQCDACTSVTQMGSYERYSGKAVN